MNVNICVYMNEQTTDQVSYVHTRIMPLILSDMDHEQKTVFTHSFLCSIATAQYQVVRGKKLVVEVYDDGY